MNIRRKTEGKIIAGVASGLAETLGVDVSIIRIVFAVVSVFAGGGVLLYLILWAVIPRETGGTLAEDGIHKAREWYGDRKRPDSPRDYDI